MAKLLLVDGNAMMHRAYHAYPTSLTNATGQPINAVYGFFSLLLLALQDQSPTHLVICFDRGAPTIRQTMYAGYHAHRPRMNEDFVPQVVLIHELLEKMKVAVFELDGFEGDDLIGTIAHKVIENGERRTESIEVIILTGDRDLLQLVNPHVKVMMPLVGITKTAMFDEKAVEEKYGVHPSQFIDYKALIGDASDGYPGVTGIGPKTAASLLQQYKTFENLYEHVGELPEKVGLKLATDAEQAALAKKLATIMLDVPIQFDLAACACNNFDIAALRKAFVQQDFKSLLKRVDTVFGVEPSDEQLALL